MAERLSQAVPARPTKLDLPRMTYGQFLERDLPNSHVEWVNGAVVTMAPVSIEHQGVRSFLRVLLTHFIEAHDLGRLLDEPFQMKTGAELPGRAPDIQFISKRNLGRLKRDHLQGP